MNEEQELPKEFLLTAPQANELASKNGIKIEEALRHVENQSKNGQKYCQYIGVELPSVVSYKLMELGYTISNAINPFGEKITKISW